MNVEHKTITIMEENKDKNEQEGKKMIQNYFYGDVKNVVNGDYFDYKRLDDTWFGIIKCDVSTICVGMAASMGAFLLAGGAKGKRQALPNAEIMIHQPSGGTRGQASDIRIEADHILKIKRRLNEELAANTNQPIEVIERDTDRDNWMSADEAVAYGLIDSVVRNR